MKVRTLLFPYLTREQIAEVEQYLKKTVGAKNYDFYGLDAESECPSVDVICTKEQWRAIKFKLNLHKCYW